MKSKLLKLIDFLWRRTPASGTCWTFSVIPNRPVIKAICTAGTREAPIILHVDIPLSYACLGQVDNKLCIFECSALDQLNAANKGPASVVGMQAEATADTTPQSTFVLDGDQVARDIAAAAARGREA